MFKKIQQIHFVGIGGSGMSGIAEVLITLGYKVTGSDMKPTEVTQRLSALGAQIFIGHSPSNSENAHVVVTSTAVAKDNPEVAAARARGVPVIPRIEMLAELARLKYTIAIAGTHGKTTTTSMVASILNAGGLDPTVIVGGRLKHLNSGGHLGKGEYMVAEADESDGSFLKLSPALSIITNIDNDHLDYYGTFNKIEDAFVEFANRVPFYGCVAVCLDDPAIRNNLKRITRRVVTYGIEQEAQWRASNIRQDEAYTTFNISQEGRDLGLFRLRVPGRHNVLNALAGAIMGHELGIPTEAIARGLEQFEGVGRRLELKGTMGGVTVIDDYGHHPTEIRATLSALRDRFPAGRIVAVFQPHRFSRTQALAKDFSESFSQADQVFLLDVYAAGEKPIPGVSSALILDLLKKKHAAAFALPTGAKGLTELLRPGDVVLTLGAGDVWKVGDELLRMMAPS